uniref:hypothetical protein n=1 Tax=Mycobacteroides abscessus TaxID=36809 RepID=UPI001A95791A|nr:hypothetical protein [Mycobacteroides abscessus]
MRHLLHHTVDESALLAHARTAFRALTISAENVVEGGPVVSPSFFFVVGHQSRLTEATSSGLRYRVSHPGHL